VPGAAAGALGAAAAGPLAAATGPWAAAAGPWAAAAGPWAGVVTAGAWAGVAAVVAVGLCAENKIIGACARGNTWTSVTTNLRAEKTTFDRIACPNQKSSVEKHWTIVMFNGFSGRVKGFEFAPGLARPLPEQGRLQG
jgi:hypothetical protein